MLPMTPRNELTNSSKRLSRNAISKDAVIRLITNQTMTIKVPFNLVRSFKVVSFVDQKDCLLGYNFSRAILALNLKCIRYPRLCFWHWEVLQKAGDNNISRRVSQFTEELTIKTGSTATVFITCRRGTTFAHSGRLFRHTTQICASLILIIAQIRVECASDIFRGAEPFGADLFQHDNLSFLDVVVDAFHKSLVAKNFIPFKIQTAAITNQSHSASGDNNFCGKYPIA
jgi:hypothetical protein